MSIVAKKKSFLLIDPPKYLKQPLLPISPCTRKAPLLHDPPVQCRLEPALEIIYLPKQKVPSPESIKVQNQISNLLKTRQIPNSSTKQKLTNNLKLQNNEWFCSFQGASSNVKTSLSEARIADLCIFCRKYGIDFLLIQETHLSGNFDKKLKDIPSFKNWRIIGSGQGGNHKKAGVAILFSPKVKVEEYEIVESARIISAKILLNGQPLVVTSCYTPDMSYADSTRGVFWRKLNNYMKKIPKIYQKITAGDFNACLVPDGGEHRGLGSFHPRCCYQKATVNNENGNELLQSVSDHNMFLENTYFENRKSCHSWTHHNIGGWKRRYDFFMVDSLVHKYSTNCRSHPSPIKSDHRLICPLKKYIFHGFFKSMHFFNQNLDFFEFLKF